MSKYLELVEGSFNESHFNKQKNQNPYVAYSINDDRAIYTIIPKPGVYDPWVTFTAEEANSTIRLSKLSTNQTLEYSADTSTWNTFDTTTSIPLNTGDKVYVRGILSADNTAYNYTQFKMSGKITAGGNCNTIWNYQNLKAPLKKYCGCYMFRNCKSLTAAPDLPATVLDKSCYQNMFSGCSTLTSMPELPAVTLAEHCYNSMFNGCSTLALTSDLPATMLSARCYQNMFDGCSTLTSAPELPATMLVEGCYY